jgi:hypothetical protein
MLRSVLNERAQLQNAYDSVNHGWALTIDRFFNNPVNRHEPLLTHHWLVADLSLFPKYIQRFNTLISAYYRIYVTWMHSLFAFVLSSSWSEVSKADIIAVRSSRHCCNLKHRLYCTSTSLCNPFPRYKIWLSDAQQTVRGTSTELDIQLLPSISKRYVEAKSSSTVTERKAKHIRMLLTTIQTLNQIVGTSMRS